MKKNKRPTIGLALGSGGSRGLAHIGIIKVLEAHGIPIDFIAGSSIGSMIGGFYASGMNIQNIEDIALKANWRQIFSMVDPHLGSGLIGGKKVSSFIESKIKGKTIEDCLIPFVAVATDLKNGEAVILNRGDMVKAIRASISIPLVFKPVIIDGRLLADAGLSAPVPVDIVRSMGADIVIAVNLDRHYHVEKRKFAWYDLANNSLDVLRHNLALANVKNADIVIDIDVGKNYWYQFVNGQDKVLAGEQAALKILPQLDLLMNK
ncbi:MAG: patatin-like phospholipase family protein [bacterium]